MKKRGRPKGSTTSAIGLHKRLKLSKITPFTSKSGTEQDKIMLGWFLRSDYVDEVMNGERMDAKAVHTDPSKVSYACAETEKVDIKRLKKYFSAKAWDKIEKIVKVKKDIPDEFWPCIVCQLQLSVHTEALQCDSCLEWSHVKCTPKKTAPKAKVWYCPTCRSNV